MMPEPTLLETVRLRRGAAPLWPLHRRRLGASAARLGLVLPPVTPPPRHPDGVWRLELDRTGVRETFRDPEGGEAISIRTVAVVHPGYPHKTTDRGAFDIARRDARRVGADEALLLTAEGLVAECSIWSLLWWELDGLAGPALDLGVLPGVGRERLRQVAGGVAERRLGRAGLEGRSLVVVNAVRGPVPVVELDGVPVPPDPRTDLLRQQFWP